ncbi:MAG: hypothetical protein ACN6OT_03730 [Comamonas sp.]
MRQGMRQLLLAQGIAALASLAAAMPLLVSAQTGRNAGAVATTAPEGLAVTPSNNFEKRFAPLYAAVFSEGGRFSGSAMSADLQALEPILKRTKAPALDFFRLYYTQATIFSRRAMPAEAGQVAQKALVAMPKPSDPQWAYPHLELSIASIRWLAEGGRYEAAVKQAQTLITRYPLQEIARLPAQMRWDNSTPIPQAADYPTQLQILGVYEDLGYVLHEQGQYRQALQANQQLLPVARERLLALGETPRLRGLLANLAQNSYMLGQMDAARNYLQERLQIAISAGDHDTVYDSYFQLMVLAHEQNQPQQAQQWLSAYAQYARAQGHSDQLARAEQLRDELNGREAAPPPQQPAQPPAPQPPRQPKR